MTRTLRANLLCGLTAIAALILSAQIALVPAATAQSATEQFAQTVTAPIATRTERALSRALVDQISQDDMANAWWGIQVYDLTNDRTLFSHQADRSYIPASNTKLYTTAAALDVLGPDWRYKTELFAIGPVEDGVLRGPLVVRGSGDPVIGGRFNGGDLTLTFRQWADSLRTAGIRVIEGDIVGDDDVFDDIPLGYGWSWDDETWWYSAEIGGLSFNDNCVDLTLVGQHAGAPATLDWVPQHSGLVEVINASLSTAAGGRVEEGYTRDRGTNRIVVTSRVPSGQTERESITVRNPTLFFVSVLRDVLQQAGIAVLGQGRDVDDLSIRPDYSPESSRRIASHASAPLADIARVVNKVSQNLYAEQLLQTLGAVRPIPGRTEQPGSAKMGLAVMRDMLGHAAVDTSRIQLVDGSGLSRMNLVTPEMTEALLRYMWNHPDTAVRDAYLFSLPVGGVDGSLSRRFGQGAAHGNVRAKTGTVSNASTLSGYVTTAGGSTLAFSIMNNHFTTSATASRAIQDRLVELLALYMK